ncbi:helix-turn-helix transcriptional regulator [Mycobacterium sp. Aquia_213]|uniref:helix-turn-helix transcriptional regulator n=1 Tax=Mycobacterium sp. Aquia_213 TaxID=2991728 RepID=UPI00227174DE|nr:helix-turn-helix transcriptional regulator [Mycobacterium sp. Aquia_213]WAC94056.1 helix-turn-helix transcriptional regulator [Mycobacterium sp. Aquia_213]
MNESAAIQRRFELIDGAGGSPSGPADIEPGSRSTGGRVPNASALAQFLRNRREQLQPTDVGLPSGGRRRVVGLRREEVAALAGVSVDYYLRIEQGREKSPSDQVLDGIARALKLDDDDAAYLRDLVRRPRSGKRCPKDLAPEIHSLINSWPLTAVHIHDCSLNLVAANPIAGAVFPQLDIGDNALLSLFLDPGSRNFYRNWDRLTTRAVCWLRVYAVRNPDPGLTAVIDELLKRSERFRMLWSRPDVTHDNSGKKKVMHPQVGPITLHFQHMTLEPSGHVLVPFWAQPGSSSERALRQLCGA